MSAIQELADNEIEAARESLLASAMEHKQAQEETLAAMDAAGQPVRTSSDDQDRPVVAEIKHSIPRSVPEFATKAGALPAPEQPAATESPSAKAARGRTMLAEGYAISPEMQECIRLDDQFAEKRADDAVARAREIAEAFNQVAPVLVERTNAAVDAADAYLAARAALADAREGYDGILRAARAEGFPAADVPVIPRVSIIGAQNTEAGYRVRKIISALGQLGGW